MKRLARWVDRVYTFIYVWLSQRLLWAFTINGAIYASGNETFISLWLCSFSMDEQDQKPPLNFFKIPERDSAQKASEFGRLALEDARASKLLYKNKFYRQSLFFLQQSVEKSLKASMALLMPYDDFKKNVKEEIGHSSPEAIMTLLDNLISSKKLENPLYLKQLEALAQAIKINKNLRIIYRKYNQILGIIEQPKELFAHALQEIKSRKKKLDPKEKEIMWLKTLNLDDTHPLIQSFKQYSKSSAQTLKIRFGVFILAKVLDRLKQPKDRVEAKLNLILLSFPMLYYASYITAWHETPTRYPKVDESDYGDPFEYTPDKELIKTLPKLIEYALLASEIIVDVSNTAVAYYDNKNAVDALS